MSEFLLLTGRNDYKILFKKQSIDAADREVGKGYTVLYTSGGEKMSVKETPEEIYAMLEK